ncbi:5'-nucleotidase [Halalkaliarchaeum desulfuricum]|uniref:5'-nucleotidase SurE n=1 Tax=Halalkaliarchaeum desulfuricum TaxID=2055893 RepID=A0A343TMD9_9EURY|nr:5'/3'-nucleotidase SurE [Halalkaliarchaeum desulfuricum]AUX10261.1 5'-nucleotidase [Halalkaliarchaeum desulfuricum]
MTELLLTNDDGIDAPGIRAVYDALSTEYDVTVVAPATNQSGAGGARTWWESTLEYDEHELGYAVRGTPADCVAFAFAGLDLEPSLVVSGCNDGPNIGAHILGRSGTVGAAHEAALLSVPGIAVSLYDLSDLPPTNAVPSVDDFAVAADVTHRLVDRWLTDGPIEGADYLNVNVPAPASARNLGSTIGGTDRSESNWPPMRFTRPATGYDVTTVDPTDPEVTARGEAGIELRDRFWRSFLNLDVPDPVGTDRRAAVDGEISISPLSVGRPVSTDIVGETFALERDGSAASD